MNIVLTEQNTVQSLLRWGKNYLSENGVKTAQLDSELLLSEVLALKRADLYSHNIDIDKKQKEFYKQFIKRRGNREPLQHIVGYTEFMGIKIQLNPNVFIPRPETEVLVEKVIEGLTGDRMQDAGNRMQDAGDRMQDAGCKLKSEACSLNIVDIGTGSGAIPIALTMNLTDCKIIAFDISQEALAIAVKNAKQHNVLERISFYEKNMLSDWEDTIPKNVDIIVSNPPYIPKKDFSLLDKEILFEPRIALDGGEDGLKYYRYIIEESPLFLKNNGLLIMELGDGQAEAISNITKNIYGLEVKELVKDYNGVERVVVIEKM